MCGASPAESWTVLHSEYRFTEKGASLQQFLQRKFNKSKELYTLAEILLDLTELIKSERLYDPKNNPIIICSEELEMALNMKALHVNEMRPLVLSLLVLVNSKSQPDTTQPALQRRVNPRLPVPSPPAPPDKSARFKLKEKFREVLLSTKNDGKDQTIFRYDEVTALFARYILSRRMDLFDPRNIKLAFVKNDPLGEAFGVNSFHRLQVTNLINQQLILVPSKELEIEQSNSGCSTSSQSEQSFPSVSPFPTLQKAASLPAGSSAGSLLMSVLRKRSLSGETKEDQTSKRLHSDASEKETEEERQNSEGTDTDSEHETYQLEYDVDTAEDEKRPTQAGSGSCSSSDSDSCIEIEKLEKSRIDDFQDKAKEDLDNWADSENEIANADAPKRSSLAPSSKCVRCLSPMTNRMLLCSACWNAHKNWLPDRPRARRGRRKPQLQPNNHTQQEENDFKFPVTAASKASIFVDVGETMTDGVDVTALGASTSTDSGISSQDSTENDRTSVTHAEITRDDAIDEKSSGLSELLKAIKGPSPNGQIVKLEAENAMLKAQLSLSKSATVNQLEVSSCSSSGSSSSTSSLCMFCYQRQKNASLIHGRLGHQVSCYPCAKKLWKRQANCPVCRRKIEKIVKIIVA